MSQPDIGVHTRLVGDRTLIHSYKGSWGGITAGVAVALVVQLLLNLLGAGIGAAVIDPTSLQANPSATTLSSTSAAWFVVSGLVASFVGGYVASRLSGRALRSTGALQGLTSWAVTTLVVFYLLTSSIGAVVGGVFSGIGGIVSGAGSTVTTAATSAAPALGKVTDPLGLIEQQIRDASGGNDPATLREAATASVRAALTGDPAKAEEARNRAADALARAQNIPIDQARQQVAQYEQEYKDGLAQAKQKAADAAQVAAKAFSVGAIAAVIALVLGAIAALIGGAVGTVRVVPVGYIAER